MSIFMSTCKNTVFLNSTNIKDLCKNLNNFKSFSGKNVLTTIYLVNILAPRNNKCKNSLLLLFFFKTNNLIKYNAFSNFNKGSLNFLWVNSTILSKYNTIFKTTTINNLPYGVVTDNNLSINYNNTTIKNNSSSVCKYLQNSLSDAVNVEFLRKNKVYNKGRYSRCRQNYRTGVYMCMYLSVVCMFGLYYWFFKFSFNFTYLWWFFIGFIGSFFLPKIIKYRLYKPSVIISKFNGLFNWLFMVLKSVL